MKNQELVDSLVLINSMPPGTMKYDIIGLGSPAGTPKLQGAFLIREDQSRLDMISEDHIQVEFRSSALLLEDVILIPLLIQINHNPSLTYAGWFNYYESEDMRDYFDALIRQELLYILFFTGDTKPARKFAVNNNLQLGFKMHLQQLKNRIPWSIEDFGYAKFKMLKKYPTSLSLWHGIKRNAESK